MLVQQDGKLLLVQRGPEGAFPGSWNLPAGYCEADEAPQVAAARETEEETGLQVQVGCLVDAYFFDDDARGNGLLLVYEAEVTGGELQCDGHETISVEFFSPSRLPKPLCGGGHDQAIEAWQQRALNRWQPGEPLRFCPHCAHLLEEQYAFGRVRPVCAACGFVHFQSLKVGVSVLIEHEGRVLLVQRAIEPGLGQWGLPSGFVEWDESPETAAARECLEETGLTVANLDLLEVAYYTDDFRGPGINLTYKAAIVSGDLQPGDDAGAAQFFSPTQLSLKEALAFRTHHRVLERWQNALNMQLSKSH